MTFINDFFQRSLTPVWSLHDSINQVSPISHQFCAPLKNLVTSWGNGKWHLALDDFFQRRLTPVWSLQDSINQLSPIFHLYFESQSKVNSMKLYLSLK